MIGVPEHHFTDIQAPIFEALKIVF